MDKELVINQTVNYVKQILSGDPTGHDWFHTERVCKTASMLAEKENADMFIVQLGALLHDISDWKFNNGDDSIGPKMANIWLSSFGVPVEIINHVSLIISTVSFKGARVDTQMKTLEGMIVQDADRLDAMGAIGIARAFAYGGYANREIYNPDIAYKLHENEDQYKNNSSPSINHFYEKLLLLKDLMNTKTAKEIANYRHNYMQNFLEEFFKEWVGIC